MMHEKFWFCAIEDEGQIKQIGEWFSYCDKALKGCETLAQEYGTAYLLEATHVCRKGSIEWARLAQPQETI